MKFVLRKLLFSSSYPADHRNINKNLNYGARALSCAGWVAGASDITSCSVLGRLALHSSGKVEMGRWVDVNCGDMACGFVLVC